MRDADGIDHRQRRLWGGKCGLGRGERGASRAGDRPRGQILRIVEQDDRCTALKKCVRFYRSKAISRKGISKMDVGKNRRKRGKEKKGKRLFGAVMLALMAVLAVGAVAFAEGGGSYSLVIEKRFAADTPEEAKEQSYQFKITGEIIDGKGDKTPINETITLPKDGDEEDQWKYTYYADAPFRATVTEITSGIQVDDSNGEAYNMGNTTCETEALLRGLEPQKLQLKNNAKITISRPTEVKEGDGTRPLTTTTTFHIYNSPYPGHSTVSRPIDAYFELAPGAAAKEFNSLRAGIYTIEEMKAPDGYTVQVGERTADVLPDAQGNAVGEFYINGNPGRLTITAGGTKGDGVTHYYTVERVAKPNGDQGVFEPRTVCARSGEEHTIDDLPKGSYKVTEHTYAGRSGYTLTVPEMKNENWQPEVTNTTSYRAIILPKDADGFRLLKFGPLINVSGNKMSASDTYTTLRYGITSNDGRVSRKGSFSNSTPFKGGSRYTVKEPTMVGLSPDKKLWFSVFGVSNTKTKKVEVNLDVFYSKIDRYDKGFESSNTKTVDERGWMIFSKEQDISQGSENLTYHYTITSSDKKPVADCSVTDANGSLINGAMEIVDDSTVRLALKAGQSVRLNGLEKGTYSITETVDEDRADGFKMKIVGCSVNITTADTSYPITVQGGRTLTISKPACPAGSYGDGGRDYTFKVVDENKNIVGGLIIVKAGGERTITLPKAGPYEVIPVDEADPFQMTYTDSSSINGIAQGRPSATITFTNVFTKGKGSYRYIHEYYLKTGEDSYRYEGSSQITHVRGLDINDRDIYQALDIVEEPIFEKDGIVYTYTHFSEGYGKVDISDTEGDKNRGAEVAELSLDDLEDRRGPDADDWIEATRSDADVPTDSSRSDAADPTDRDPPAIVDPTEEDPAIDDPSDGESSGEDDPKDGTESDTEVPTDEEGSKADAPTNEEGSKADGPTDEEGSKADIPTDGDGSKADAPADEEESRADAPTEADNAKTDDPTDQDGSDAENQADGDKAGVDSPTSDKEAAMGDLTDGSSDRAGSSADEGNSQVMQTYGFRITDPPPALCMAKEPVFVIGDAIYKSTHLARTMLQQMSQMESIAIDGPTDAKDSDVIGLTDGDMTKTKDMPAAEDSDGDRPRVEGPTDESEPDADDLTDESKPDAGDPTDVSKLDTDDPSNEDTSDIEDPVEEGGPNAGDPTDEDKVDDEGLTDEGRSDTEDPSDESGPDEERPTDENRSGVDDPTDLASSSAARNAGRLLEDETEAYAARDLQQTVGDDGLVVVGSGVESGAGELYYETDPDMDYAVATEKGDDIIILRYFREIPEDKKGTYKVLHMYYYRDDQGDHLEGTSRYETKNGQLGDHTYDASGIPLIETPPEEQVGGRYTYVHDKRPQYGVLVPDGSAPDSKITEDRKGGYVGGGYASRPDINWSSVRATEDGSQVIILRYYREVGGSYKIVHEYYVRERDVDVAEEEIPSEDRAEVGEDSAIGSEDDSASALETGLSDGDEVQIAAYADTFSGTLDTDDAGYSYRFEGARSIESRRAKLGTDHTGVEQDWKPDYGSRQYIYHSVVYGEVDQAERYDKIIDKQWATATEDGEQIIILRYYRDGAVPDVPDETDPTPPPPGGGGGRHHRDPDPDPTPPSTTAPDPTSEQPTETIDENPGYPTELPDPNAPNSPDRITIWENGVPKTYVKVWNPETGMWEYILEEEVPLSSQDLPKTGDKSRNILWMTLFIGSVVGILWLIAVRRKQRS